MKSEDLSTNKTLFFREAARISSYLIKMAVRAERGIYWKTYSIYDAERNKISEVREDIYGGNAGIIIYLIDFYRITGDVAVRDAVRDAIDWLIHHCDSKPPASFAFYTGRSGVSYVLLKAYKLFGDEEYLKAAEKFLEQSNDLFISGGHPGIDDLINGASGLLLANLHIYVVLKKEFYKEVMVSIVDHLLTKVNFGRRGIYWDRSARQVDGLCGFSHGASGLAWVFAELGNFFNDNFCKAIAKQAVYYENTYFDKENLNWPDLRSEMNEAVLAAGSLAKFNFERTQSYRRENAMHAWCHGAPGIGLSRHRLYEISGDKRLLSQARVALQSTIKYCDSAVGINPSYTLCHGIGGNAYLLFLLYRTYKEPDLLLKIQNYGLRALEQKGKYDHYFSGFNGDPEEHMGLFNGIAGIGYFFLQCIYPGDKELDILQPIPAGKGDFPFPLRSVNQKMFSSLFPRTVSLIQKDIGEAVFEKMELDYFNTDLKGEIIRSIGELSDKCPSGGIIAMALKYEKSIVFFDQRVRNRSGLYGYNYWKEKTASASVNLSLSESDQLQMCPTCKLIRNGFAGNLSGKPDYIVLRQTHLGIQEIPISFLKAIICRLLKKPMEIQAIIEVVNRKYSFSDPGFDMDWIIRDAVISLIIQGILVYDQPE